MPNPYMQYLDPIPQQGQQSQQQVAQPGGARKYTGATAQGYDAKRETSAKWVAEQQIIEDMLSDLPRGSVILDAPCGTGRFFDFYAQKEFVVGALDTSADMIALAAQKITDPNSLIDGKRQWSFAQGDVRNTDLPEGYVDASVMVRLTRWLEPEECQAAFRELQRVTRGRIILTARVANHPHMRPVELFEAVLEPGWKLTRNEPGATGTPEAAQVDEDYRILMFEKVEG